MAFDKTHVDIRLVLRYICGKNLATITLINMFLSNSYVGYHTGGSTGSNKTVLPENKFSGEENIRKFLHASKSSWR